MQSVPEKVKNIQKYSGKRSRMQFRAPGAVLMMMLDGMLSLIDWILKTWIPNVFRFARRAQSQSWFHYSFNAEKWGERRSCSDSINTVSRKKSKITDGIAKKRELKSAVITICSIFCAAEQFPHTDNESEACLARLPDNFMQNSTLCSADARRELKKIPPPPTISMQISVYNFIDVESRLRLVHPRRMKRENKHNYINLFPIAQARARSETAIPSQFAFIIMKLKGFFPVENAESRALD